MNHFTTNLMEILYQGESIDELIRKEIEKAVNELLQTELTAFGSSTLFRTLAKRHSIKPFAYSGLTTVSG